MKMNTLLLLNKPTKAEFMHLSAHAAEGTTSIATFSLLITIGGHQTVALVDSGSSHTFMDYNLLSKVIVVSLPLNPKA